MFESREVLLEQIKLGVDGRLECKQMIFAGQKVKGPTRDEIADELAAFANAKGGVMVFGVDDKTHDVVGIPEDKLDLAERFVQQLCHDSIRPGLLAADVSLSGSVVLVTSASGEPAVVATGSIRTDQANAFLILIAVASAPSGVVFHVDAQSQQSVDNVAFFNVGDLLTVTGLSSAEVRVPGIAGRWGRLVLTLTTDSASSQRVLVDVRVIGLMTPRMTAADALAP